MDKRHTQQKSSDGKFKKSLIAMAIVGFTQQAYAQEAPATQEEETEQYETEVIEVKGIRGALETAADLKRSSKTFVDSITATDANVLPDLSVAEALARIPGITVTRFTAGADDFPSPEGSGNLIRGLGFVRSEFNGRDAFSANGGRALDWSAIPPELIGGVDVYKNQSADLIEGGIGGSINLRTLEPFDREGRILIFSADTTYTDLREEWSPSFSVVAGDRWKNSKGEFGLLGSFSTSDLASEIHGFQTAAPNPRDNIPQDAFTGDYIPEAGSVVAVPQGFQLRTNQVDRTRDSFYVAGQWRSPDNDTELTVKYIRVENDSNSVERTTESFTDANSWNRFELSELVVKPFTSDGIARCNGNNESPVGFCDETVPVTGGLMEQGMLTDSGDSWYGAYGLQLSNLGVGIQQESMTDDLSFNLKMRPTDNWMVEVDAHHTTADSKRRELWVGSNTFVQAFYRPDLDNPYLEFSHDPRLAIGDFIFDEGNNQNAWQYPTSTADAGSTFMPFISDGFQDGEGELTAVRADATYQFEGDSWFESVKFGARYSEREQVNRDAGMNWQAASQAWNGGMAMYNNFDTVAHEVVDMSNFYRGGVLGGDNTSFVFVDSNLLRNPHQFFDFYQNEPDLANGAWNPYSANGIERRTQDGKYTPIYEPNQISDITEETLNLYVRLDFYHQLGDGMDIEGNVGLRYTRTQSMSDGELRYNQVWEDTDDVDLPDYPQSAEDRDHPADFLPESVAYLEQASSDRTVDLTDDHFLPSLNVKWNLNDDMLLRFGVSKAVTRPNIQDLRAAQTVSGAFTTVQFDPLPEDDPNFGIARGAEDIFLRSINVNGGNPDLKSTEAVNWDLSFEWYFEDGEYFSAAVFNKDLKNIITFGVDVQDTITLDGESVNYQYVGPVNQADAEIRGIEFSYQDFFDDLPGIWSNLGVQANYTYIDASATPPPAFLDADDDGQPDEGSFANNLRFGRSDLVGQSRHTANLIGIYQDDKFEVRIAYNYRSHYLNNYRDWITGDPLFQRPTSFVDVSLRYDVTDNVQLSFNGANIFDEKSSSEAQIDQSGQRYMRSSFLNDRRFKFGIRYTY
ncbi:TonB-dependent receptor [Marisediminitalea aggregata]|uniref:TonB-dependent receptor n=1 Tax=Marisediminitalea aggregata TaxID=634436 RepID=A0A1M5EME1_9ALTE|nr:TonB-dependent receptor [Marisediminitalea aggregata]MEC7824180.1 TonB-dependent receptor [Pseudomonadota bacterium]SHF80346.1 TonB-dependent receptor [Marisediminitalea aggregata]